MALQAGVDRGYLSLLAHLRSARPPLPPETLQAAICHYLVHLPSTQPTPTPLTASIAASPVWHPLSLQTCVTLGTTFRTAIRRNCIELKKKNRGLFDASLSSDLTSWTHTVLAGLNDGPALLRLAISGGLLLGLKDLQDDKVGQRLFRDVEETAVLAFAELTEGAAAKDQWTIEFKQSGRNPAERVEFAVLLASQYFNWVSTEALSALNLIRLAISCLSEIEKGFASGNYLRSSCESFVRDGTGAITLSPGSNIEPEIDALLASECYTCMAYLCRLVARITTILSDTIFRARKRRELWNLFNDVAQNLHLIACRVQETWGSSLLAEVQVETQLDKKANKLTKKIWIILKTQLFSSLMLQQAILDTILFHPPPSPQPATSRPYSPVYLTSTILKTLSSLSFVIASFGGVTAGTASGSKGPTFPELKKVFYMSIDILSTNKSESKSFVCDLVHDADACRGSASPIVNAKLSFVLACIEQFITVLDDRCIEEVVLPFCEPHLGDPSQRQTYEAAHSVMLSIFAAHAENGACAAFSRPSKTESKGKAAERTSDVGLATRLVPGYAECLLENAKDGGLTTSQLRLAYAALVRSASTGRHAGALTTIGPSEQSSSRVQGAWRWTRGDSDAGEEFAGDPSLAWLCVEQLLQALSAPAANATDSQTRFALSLTLISLISNVGLVLLPRVLKEVESVVDNEAEEGRRRVLIENVFEEVLENGGDAARDVAMKWWFARSRQWGASSDSGTDERESR